MQSEGLKSEEQVKGKASTADESREASKGTRQATQQHCWGSFLCNGYHAGTRGSICNQEKSTH